MTAITLSMKKMVVD